MRSLTAGHLEARPPFAVAAVEQDQLVARPEPQNRHGVVRLRPVELDHRSGAERRRHEEALRGEIIGGHVTQLPFRAAQRLFGAKVATFLWLCQHAPSMTYLDERASVLAEPHAR